MPVRAQHGRRWRRRGPAAAAPVALLLLLGGCTDAGEAPPAAASSSTPRDAPAAPPASEDGGAAAGEDATGDDGAVGGSPAPEQAAAPCAPDERDGIAATLDGQLAAIAADDWSTAHGHASDAFRGDVDPDGLAAIVEEGFPVLADNVAHELGPCVSTGDAAQAVVAVSDAAGRASEVVYTLVREDGTWQVAGAVPHGEPSGGGSPAEIV